MTGTALCFSGGGFRATLFHLGVLQRLCETKEIEKISVVTGVSGGSVLAAHLALNWNDYLRGDEHRERVIREIVEFAQRDIRGRLIRRWLLAPVLFPFLGFKVFARVSLLEAEYSRLYKKQSLAILGPTEECPTRPTFYLLATSMTSGNVCAFSSIGLELENVVHGRQILPVALAVASSSAFPPLFPPVVLTRHRLDAPPEKFPHRFECLSDGGVYDNLGIRWLLSKKDQDYDRIVLCDASAPMGWKVDSKFSSIITRTVRATDILMRRVVDFDRKMPTAPDNRSLSRIDLVSIQMSGSGKDALHEELRIRLPLIRTDLNKFNNDEVRLLIEHGRAVADQVFFHPGATNMNRLFLTESERKVLAQSHVALKNARRNPIGLLNFKDWASYLLFGAVIAPFLFVWLEFASKSEKLQARDIQIRSLESTINVQKKKISSLETLSYSDHQLSVERQVHVHFVSSLPGSIDVKLTSSSIDCLKQQFCEISDWHPYWGIYFSSSQPGNFPLVVKNISSKMIQIQVAKHIPGTDILENWNDSFELGAGESVIYFIIAK